MTPEETKKLVRDYIASGFDMEIPDAQILAAIAPALAKLAARLDALEAQQAKPAVVSVARFNVLSAPRTVSTRRKVAA